MSREVFGIPGTSGLVFQKMFNLKVVEVFHIPAVKLKRTDTTLDLSQRAKEKMRSKKMRKQRTGII